MVFTRLRSHQNLHTTPIGIIIIIIAKCQKGKFTSDTLGQRTRIRKPECRDHVGNEERIRSSQRHSHQSVRPPPLALQMKGLMISNVDKVDQTMDSIREQMDLTNEISDAISNPVGMGNQVDEVCPLPIVPCSVY